MYITTGCGVCGDDENHRENKSNQKPKALPQSRAKPMKKPIKQNNILETKENMAGDPDGPHRCSALWFCLFC